MSNKSITVYAEALKRQQQETKQAGQTKATSNSTEESTRKVTQKSTSPRENVRDISRDNPRAISRKNQRDRSRDNLSEIPRKKARRTLRTLPTRDEIQAFSFGLRDELEAKVQAQVPHYWQEDLDEIAHSLKVKKLELYRFIIGEFLCKVKRKGDT